MPGIVSKFLDFVGLEETQPRDEREVVDDYYDDYDRGGYERGRYESGRGSGRGGRHDDRGEGGYSGRYEERRYEEREERPGRARERSDGNRRKGGGNVVNHPSADLGGQHHMRIYQMEDYDDARTVIDDLLADRSVLINLELVEVDVSQRIVDMLSGATYALGASLKKAAANTYVLAPLSVDVSGSYEEEDGGRRRGGSFFGGGRR